MTVARLWSHVARWRHSRTGVFHVAHSFEDLARIESDAVTIPVIEETVRVHKQEELTGRVRVSKHVHEREETIDEPLLHEEVQVERIPVGRWIDGPVEARYEGDTLIIPLLEEVMVVEKRLRLKEELRITRHRTEVRHPQSIVLRSEEAIIERAGADLPAQDDADQ
jgi:uncharacterized protein (TIGR02271 family)